MLCAKAAHGNPGSGPSAAWRLGEETGRARWRATQQNQVSCTVWWRKSKIQVRSAENKVRTLWQALKVVFFLTQVTADTKMSIKGTMY